MGATEILLKQGRRISELEGNLHHEKRSHKRTSNEVVRLDKLRISYRDRLKEQRLQIGELETQLAERVPFAVFQNHCTWIGCSPKDCTKQTCTRIPGD